MCYFRKKKDSTPFTPPPPIRIPIERKYISKTRHSKPKNKKNVKKVHTR